MDSDQVYNEYMAQRAQLEEWKRRHSMFAHEITRIQKHIDKLMSQRDNALVLYRQSKKQVYLEQANTLLLQAQNHLKTFSKLELLASLSKR